MNPPGVQEPRSDRPVRREQPADRACVLWAKTTGVYDPVALDKHLNSPCYGVWCAGVLCIIRGVLNDLCSICNWVALPEISVGLTLKLSLILGRLRWDGPTSQDRDLTGVEESKAALSALFKCQADVKRSRPVSLKPHAANFIPEWHVWTNKCQLHIWQHYI